MIVSQGFEHFSPPAAGVALSVGNFDGAHRGHARIVAAVREVAAHLGALPAVMTFDPHPLVVLAPERAPQRLTTLAERLTLLERLGVQQILVLRSEPGLLACEAEDFLASLVAHCRPRALVEGPDFNFGAGRRGSIDTLRVNAARWGYELHVVPAVQCDELASRPTISSSSVRQALRDGRVDDANTMLGRPYRIVGVTTGGAGRGAHLGFPTANLARIPQMLPQQAVYAAIAQLEDGALHAAAVNIGSQPTFADEHVRVEAHLLDFGGDLRGRRVGLYFLARLRAQLGFISRNALIEQITRDVAATRQAVKAVGHFEPLPF